MKHKKDMNMNRTHGEKNTNLGHFPPPYQGAREAYYLQGRSRVTLHYFNYT
jgi:hypothetical protein